MERRFRITVDGRQYDVTVDDLTEGGSLLYPQPGSMTVPAPSAAPAAAAPTPAAAAAAGPGDVLSTMGGVVDAVRVAVGQAVSEGDEILIVQAMKMNMPILAPRAGTVLNVAVKPGDAIEPGQILATIG
jgi:biotin carboxyl carrier protein